MAKHYIYINTRKNTIIFETVQPNYVSMSDVDMMVLVKTGTDPRLNPVLISRSIRVVSEDFTIPKPKPKPKPKKRTPKKR